MSTTLAGLERECARHLRRHLAEGGEAQLHSAYELGRSALAAGTGVLDFGSALLRAAFAVLARRSHREPAPTAAAVEAFVLEALSPFEMALRGAREANQVLRHLDDVREAEIRRLAHELHDSAGQLLASVHLALDDLQPDLDPAAHPRLERAKILLVRTEEQLRRLSHEFRPSALDDLGLTPALDSLAESVSRRTGIRIAVEGGTHGRLPPRVETALYRIAQESLSNVARHSRARAATLRLERLGDGIHFTIEDDGIGLETAGRLPGASGTGLGLRGIRERVSALRGAVTMMEPAGGGTRVCVKIPLEVDHAVAGADR